ncbi:MAG: Gfo/Idh/MocA family oxidoreductase [Acidobacteria bacterium]|nr:Gfo/Idh/MocA family oxidoreductase [Acidobacteriota bacterium]
MLADKTIALIGCGYWGVNLARNLHELGALKVICDARTDLSQELAGKFPGVTVGTGYAGLLKDSQIQAVAIATPAVTHFDLVRECLQAGKDVFVEKPISLDARHARELIDLARTNKRILMVGHILQYHPAIIKLKELIAAGRLGRIQYIYSNRLNIGKLRTEENILWSFAPHDISLISMIMNGEEPIRVDAHGGAYVKPGIYDTTLTTLEFKNGVKSHVFVSWLHPFKEQKLIVVGSNKMAVFDDVSDQKLLIYPHKINFDGDIPVAMKAESYPVEFEMKEPLREELLHFSHCIETRETPKTDGIEGLNVLKILAMAEEKLMQKVI